MKKLLIALLFSGHCYAPDNMLVLPKKKRQSPSVLKEKIGEHYGDILKRQSRIITTMSQANAALVERTEELLEDDCNTTIKQLESCLQRLTLFEEQLKKAEQSAQQVLDFVSQEIGN